MIQVFGTYYIMNKNGDLDKINIEDEEQIIASLQNNKPQSLIVKKKIKNNVYFTEDMFELYSEIKTYINDNIQKNINPINIISPTLFKNNTKIEKLQKLFGLKLFLCPNDLILRPATDFGIFMLLENSIHKNADLPKAYYEIGNCYRLENEFNNSLLRSFCFELPDIHIIAKNDAYGIVNRHMLLYKEILNNFKINYAIALRITEKEFNLNLEAIKFIANSLREEIFINIVPNTIRYWETKFKFVRIDKNNEQVQLSTVQVDYQSSEIFNFTNEFKKNLIVIHSSPGSIQRMLYCLTEEG
ncbi:hypothetical protein D0T84_16065 [Dysgonomonas sp. 521]|uniref:aminoacyl--tRNA ligase-related protein n=1 Tax=Dysgonomonas sp. 521 TaxID=2302932 RepID=UPI0013D5E23F|nr:aminoacyl--tRNA ligase-related protein [Dysgonomonas sp. 521]NDV96417.1 hypothetical protein [Dysgonomonas sp. 521]